MNRDDNGGNSILEICAETLHADLLKIYNNQLPSLFSPPKCSCLVVGAKKFVLIENLISSSSIPVEFGFSAPLLCGALPFPNIRFK